jgi:uncharacterized cupin superfamily protein
MDTYNIFEPDLEDASDRPEGWRWSYARVGPKIGAGKLGASIYDLPPGQKTFPYHYEYPEEEWVLCLVGSPTLRTPDGERRLRPGDVACFPTGPLGAHQVRNDTDENVRVLILSTMNYPAVAVYPDSGKVLVVASPDQPDDRLMFKREEAVDYWEGEA